MCSSWHTETSYFSWNSWAYKGWNPQEDLDAHLARVKSLNFPLARLEKHDRLFSINHFEEFSTIPPGRKPVFNFQFFLLPLNLLFWGVVCLTSRANSWMAAAKTVGVQTHPSRLALTCGLLLYLHQQHVDLRVCSVLHKILQRKTETRSFTRLRKFRLWLSKREKNENTYTLPFMLSTYNPKLFLLNKNKIPMNLSKIVIAQSTLPRFTHATIKPGINFPKIEVVFFFLYFFLLF